MTRTEYDVVALGELLIDFTAQDVLFLYSTSVLNDSATIK